MSTSKLRACAIVVGVAMAGFEARATTLTWDVTASNGRWEPAANWGGTSPPGSEILVFNNNVQTSMTNDATNTTRNQIIFDAGATTARTIGGTTANAFVAVGGDGPLIRNSSTGAHVLNFPISVGADGLTVDANTAALTLGGAVSGSGTVTKTGGSSGGTGVGNLFVTASNSGFTGKWDVQNGIFSINNDAALGAVPASAVADAIRLDGGTLANMTARADGSFGAGFDVTLNANRGITLGSNGGVIRVGYNRTVTINGVITGAGSLTRTDSGNLILNAANTYSGGTTVSAATLSVANAGGLGTGPTTVAAGASLNLTAGAVNYTGLSSSTAGALAGAGTVNVTLGSGTATTTLDGDFSQFTGTININSSSSSNVGKVQMNGALNAAAVIDVRANGTLFSEAKGSTPRNATASLTLRGGNTSEIYGQLRLDSGAEWSGPISIAGSIASGDAHIGTFNNWLDAGAPGGVVSGTISGTSPLVLMSNATRGAVLLLSGSNTHTGTTSILQGTVRIANQLALQNSTLTGSAGTLQFGAITAADFGGLEGSRNLSLLNTSNAAVALTVGSNDATTTYSGVLSGAGGSLQKAGSGVLTLSGSNTYTGATTVAAGTLLVNGSTSGSSLTTVQAGATLGGTGSVGATRVENGAFHSPGTSPGVQTITNGLEYDAGSTLTWELFANSTASRGTDYDGVDLTGGALAITSGAILALDFGTAGAGSSVDWDNAFWGSDQSWTIVDVSGTGTWNGDLFDTLSVGNDTLGRSLTSVRPNASFNVAGVGGDLTLQYVAVPEPAALSLVGPAAAAALGFRCRRLLRKAA